MKLRLLADRKYEHEEKLAQYLAAVTLVDEQVGRLLDALEGRGLIEDTLIVFTSDHGHQTGQYGLYGKGNATVPQNLYEDSVRVPLIIAGPPQLVTAGQVRNEFVNLYDLLPTLVLAAGARQALVRYDGREAEEAATDRWYDPVHPLGERRPVPPPGEALQAQMRGALEAHLARYETPGHRAAGGLGRSPGTMPASPDGASACRVAVRRLVPRSPVRDGHCLVEQPP